MLEPQISLLAGIVEAGVAGGQLRQDIPAGVLTGLLTHTVIAVVEMQVLGTDLGASVEPDHLGRSARRA